MGGGGVASVHCVASTDCLGDHAVLVAHLTHELNTARLIRARQTRRCLQILGQELDRFQEIRIPGRLCDRPMESNVLGDTIATRSHLSVNGMQRSFDLGKL